MIEFRYDAGRICHKIFKMKSARGDIVFDGPSAPTKQGIDL